jgi:putative DNA primase/helicase
MGAIGAIMDETLQNVLERLKGVRKSQDGFEARCPAHDDKRASLSVGRGDDGRVLVRCHAGCNTVDVCQAIGLTLRDLFPPSDSGNGLGRIIATYEYCDAQGRLLFQVVRFHPKTFRQRRPDGCGGWTWKLGKTPRVLYRLRELNDADPEEWIYIVEGEKDANRLGSVGLIATCNPGGAGKWRRLSDDSALHGRRVVIIADKDDAGRKHAADVAMRLQNRARAIRVLELPGDGKDASDWFDAGGTVEELRRLVEAACDAPIPAASGQPSTEASGCPNIIGTVGAEAAKSFSEEPKLGTIDPASGRLILSRERTLPTAQACIDQFHHHAEGATLWHHAGRFLSWTDNRYIEIEDAALQQQLLRWLHAAVCMAYDSKTERWVARDFPANPHTVKAALESVKAHTHLAANTVSPSWLASGQRPDPREIVPCKSKLLHLPTMELLPPTPAFFTTSALDYDHNSNAPRPREWESFLGQLFEDDLQSSDLLQTWFGYCLTGDTSQQKMLLIVGPRRSGKGTIARVLTRLVGGSNVAGPTTSSLAGPFGLQPLIGKSLAIVSDARFSGKDIQTVIERLLCISGEDSLTIDRKHLTSVTMKLPTRFVFLTNELPRMNDSSGALAGRFMILRLTESFYGREDKSLTDRLLTELPGILNWAIEGWRRLRERGRFVQPASVEDAVRDMEDLSSPVGAFVRDRCEIGPGMRAWVDDLYRAWKYWCEADGRVSVTTKQTFGRDLMAAVPGVSTRVSTTARFYQGIALKGVPG